LRNSLTQNVKFFFQDCAFARVVLRERRVLLQRHAPWLDPNARLSYYSLTNRDQSTKLARAHMASMFQEEPATEVGSEISRLNSRSFLWSQMLQHTLITIESKARCRGLVTSFLEVNHQSTRQSKGSGAKWCQPHRRSTLNHTSLEKAH
jgi:hypothetical protein